MHRQRHIVRDARASYAKAWRVTAAARAMHTMHNTLAVECTARVRERVCGYARDVLSARAPERERFS